MDQHSKYDDYDFPQGAVSQRVFPSKRYFDLRQRIIGNIVKGGEIANAHAQLGTRGERPLTTTTIAWIPTITAESFIIRTGDFVFHDPDTDDSPLDLDRGGSANISIFSSFAGHPTNIAAGYGLAWESFSRSNSITDGILERVRPKFLVALSGVGDGAAQVLSEEAADKIMRYSYAQRNQNLQFIGVAMANYVVGNCSQDASGISVQVSGRVALKNTTGRILFIGDLVGLCIPGEHTTLVFELNPLKMIEDPRATLRLYDVKSNFTLAISESTHALFTEDPAHGGRNTYLTTAAPLSKDPADAVINPAAITRAPLSETLFERLPPQHHLVAALLSFGEQAYALGAAVNTPDAYRKDHKLTGDRIVNLLRLAIGTAFGFEPARAGLSELAAQMKIVGPAISKEMKEMQIACDRLSEVMVDPHAGLSVTPPIARVIRGGKPDESIAINLIT